MRAGLDAPTGFIPRAVDEVDTAAAADDDDDDDDCDFVVTGSDGCGARTVEFTFAVPVRTELGDE